MSTTEGAHRAPRRMSRSQLVAVLVTALVAGLQAWQADLLPLSAPGCASAPALVLPTVTTTTTVTVTVTATPTRKAPRVRRSTRPAPAT